MENDIWGFFFGPGAEILRWDPESTKISKSKKCSYGVFNIHGSIAFGTSMFSSKRRKPQNGWELRWILFFFRF